MLDRKSDEVTVETPRDAEGLGPLRVKKTKNELRFYKFNSLRRTYPKVC